MYVCGEDNVFTVFQRRIQGAELKRKYEFDSAESELREVAFFYKNKAVDILAYLEKQNSLEVRPGIKEARKAAGMTQAQLAEAAGVPQPSIARLESGARSVSKLTLDVAIRIADALGIVDLRDL